MPIIRGDERNNRLDGTSRADDIYGYRGNDTLSGGGGEDRLYGGLGTDRLYGGAGNDRVDGDAGDDWVFGGDGDDLVFGSEGNDRLNGGRGRDYIVGGDGADYFVYDSIRGDDIPGGFSIDTIYDFDRREGDKVDLRGIDGRWSVAGDQKLRWVGEGYFVGGGVGSVNVVYDDGDAYIQIDANGDRAVDLGFELQGAGRVYASDFLL